MISSRFEQVKQPGLDPITNILALIYAKLIFKHSDWLKNF